MITKTCISKFLFVGLLVLTVLAGCKEEEFAMVKPINAGADGDVTGNGGSVTKTHEWQNSLATAELNFDITSTKGGSFQVIVKDNDGVEVINSTLTKGIGDDSRTVCSQAGTPGTWMVTIKLTDFNGDGTFSLSQGC